MKRRILTRALPRLVLAGAVGAALAGCGGGSGDGGGGLGPNDVGDLVEGEVLGTRDVDGDGRLDVSVGDIDGDGFEDFDIDGDGNFDTKLGDTNFDGRTDFDANGDGERDYDVDGDDVTDFSITDASGFLLGYSTNGRDDVAELDAQGMSTGNPTDGGLTCPGGGSDASSADDQWNNNCTLSNGVTSYYTRGVQRILYCLGFDNDQTQIGDFADAQYGGGTASAVRAYQQDRNLTVDGVVGPQTWTALRDELVVLPITADNRTNRDRSYAVANAVDDPACGSLVQFYRTLAPGAANDIDAVNPRFEGWTIANNPGETGRVEFSVRNPFQ